MKKVLKLVFNRLRYWWLILRISVARAKARRQMRFAIRHANGDSEEAMRLYWQLRFQRRYGRFPYWACELKDGEFFYRDVLYKYGDKDC